MTKKITNIVFTKNRPLQLHGYLASLYRFFPKELIDTWILYKPELFGSEYEQLFAHFPGCNIIRESDFHTDLLEIIENTETEYILFGIDDVVYFDSINFEVIDTAFRKIGDELLGFSLRIDPRQCPADFQAENITEHNINNQTVYTADWTKGESGVTRYPFELCATIYRSRDVKKLITAAMNNNPTIKRLFAPSSKLIKILGGIIKKKKLLKKFGYFFSPNNFESWNCRYLHNNPDKFGKYLAFSKICATAIQVNLVNTTTNTDKAENHPEFTVEALNEKYKQGYRIDINYFNKNKPQNTHSNNLYFPLYNKRVKNGKC